MACGLFNLMEDFILKEVNYSQQYGYSSRAKRYMRRKLNKELAPFIEDEPEHSDVSSDTEVNVDIDISHFNDSMLLSKNVDICLSITYICVLVTFYGSIIYITQAYTIHQSKTC
jgi:hypothetical protein